MRVLIMGLPGSGKTTLAEKLVEELGKTGPVEWINADDLRNENDDWDFSPAGRIRQAFRMRDISERANELEMNAVCDFVCPTVETRQIFDADLTIWLDTVKTSRYEDTNDMFEVPSAEEYDFRLESFEEVDEWVKTIADLVDILSIDSSE